MADDVNECIAVSLVREYLSRKGLKNTLQALDLECPRTMNSIGNRLELMKALHIQNHMKRNKESDQPYKTMIEVISKHFTEKGKDKMQSSVETNIRIRPKSSSKSGISNEINGDLVIDDDIEGEMTLGEGKSGLFGKVEKDDRLNFGGIINKHGPANRMRGMSGPVSSNLEEKPKHRDWKYGKPLKIDEDNVDNSNSNITNNNTEAKPSSRYKQSNFSSKGSSVFEETKSNNNPTSTSAIKNVFNVDTELEKMKEKRRLARTNSKKSNDDDDDLNSYSYDINKSSIGNDQPSRSSSRSSRYEEPLKKTATPNSKEKDLNGDTEFDEVDEGTETGFTESSPPVTFDPQTTRFTSKPIDLQTAIDLKMLLFGNFTRSFSEEWKYQGFTFSEAKRLKYGFVQKKGGPCGVLASVQAVFLQELLFNNTRKASPLCLQQGGIKRTDCLSKALANILWRAGNNKGAVVTIPTGRPQFQLSSKFKGDNLTETLLLFSFDNYEDLYTFIRQNNAQFELHGNNGVIHSLFSVVLSRTIQCVKDDMDEKFSKLIGAHNYCTQELVNLYLTGSATSNVFNDTIELDSGGKTPTILNGLKGRSDIGFLSLLEHYKSCQVGTYYKTPVFPIWVVCSESHFSVLFCLNKDLMNNWRAERRFDLYYYDGLGNQGEEIRLTIDTTNKHYVPPKDDDLVPPIDLCIRTKWGDAEIDWNGTEPLL